MGVTMASIKGRLTRLERKVPDCADAQIALLFHFDGQRPPPVPSEPRCRGCGQVHTLIVCLVTVASRPSGA
jgi:hypothetical protein